MSSHNDDSHQIDAEWFDSKREKYSNSHGKNEALSSIVNEEINALQAFYEHGASAKDSAYRITHPISTSPIPSLGTYSDETAAIITLWHILTEALVHWPAQRTSDILDLFSAIGQLPKTIQIHNGEATDAEGIHPLTWEWFPYFSLAWEDALREPGEIVRQAQQGATSGWSQSKYIYRKDIEAQLIARGVLTLKGKNVDYVAKTLEREPDEAIPADEAAANQQNRIEFQIPAVASLLKYCGGKLFNWVVQKDGNEQRWNRWETRLGEIGDNESDGPTRVAARAAVAEMRGIRG